MAEFKIITLQCDECKKQENYQTSPALYGGIKPFNGWIRGANGILDFCSAKCAEKYFANWDEK